MTGAALPLTGDKRSAAVGIIVLRATGTADPDVAVANYAASAQGESAHYLIAPDGTVSVLLEETRCARLGGPALWRGAADLDRTSVIVALCHPAREDGIAAYPEAQIAAACRLVGDVKARHGVTRGNVVGGSDIAPARWRDPGEQFPWGTLAKLRLALPRPTQKLMDPHWSEAGFLLALERFGYDVTHPMAAIMAFQRRYRPEMIDGEMDAECRMILLALLLPKPMGDE